MMEQKEDRIPGKGQNMCKGTEVLPCKSTGKVLMTPDIFPHSNRPRFYHPQHKAHSACLFPGLP